MPGLRSVLALSERHRLSQGDMIDLPAGGEPRPRVGMRADVVAPPRSMPACRRRKGTAEKTRDLHEAQRQRRATSRDQQIVERAVGGARSRRFSGLRCARVREATSPSRSQGRIGPVRCRGSRLLADRSSTALQPCDLFPDTQTLHRVDDIRSCGSQALDKAKIAVLGAGEHEDCPTSMSETWASSVDSTSWDQARRRSVEAAFSVSS